MKMNFVVSITSVKAVTALLKITFGLIFLTSSFESNVNGRSTQQAAAVTSVVVETTKSYPSWLTAPCENADLGVITSAHGIHRLLAKSFVGPHGTLREVYELKTQYEQIAQNENENGKFTLHEGTGKYLTDNKPEFQTDDTKEQFAVKSIKSLQYYSIYVHRILQNQPTERFIGDFERFRDDLRRFQCRLHQLHFLATDSNNVDGYDLTKTSKEFQAEDWSPHPSAIRRYGREYAWLNQFGDVLVQIRKALPAVFGPQVF